MTQYHPILIDDFMVDEILDDHSDEVEDGALETILKSLDKAELALRHRAKRDRETATRLMYEAAYREYGLDRKREHDRIAAEMEATLTAGIWAKSTGEYARRCRELDVTIAERVYERVV